MDPENESNNSTCFVAGDGAEITLQSPESRPLLHLFRLLHARVVLPLAQQESDESKKESDALDLDVFTRTSAEPVSFLHALMSCLGGGGDRVGDYRRFGNAHKGTPGSQFIPCAVSGGTDANIKAAVAPSLYSGSVH